MVKETQNSCKVQPNTQGAIAGGIASAVCEVPDDILNECLDRLEPPLADVINRFNEVCNQ